MENKPKNYLTILSDIKPKNEPSIIVIMLIGIIEIGSDCAINMAVGNITKNDKSNPFKTPFILSADVLIIKPKTTHIENADSVENIGSFELSLE